MIVHESLSDKQYRIQKEWDAVRYCERCGLQHGGGIDAQPNTESALRCCAGLTRIEVLQKLWERAKAKRQEGFLPDRPLSIDEQGELFAEIKRLKELTP